MCIAAEPLTDMHACCQTNDRTPNVLLFQHLHTASHSTLLFTQTSYTGLEQMQLLLLLLHPFNGLFSRTTWVSRHQIAKSFWILLQQEMMGGGSGISWTICKSFAPRSRQITMPVPHHSVFTGWMLFLPPNQQCQSTEGNWNKWKRKIKGTTG